jgi:hypothetical protein
MLLGASVVLQGLILQRLPAQHVTIGALVQTREPNARRALIAQIPLVRVQGTVDVEGTVDVNSRY